MALHLPAFLVLSRRAVRTMLASLADVGFNQYVVAGASVQFTCSLLRDVVEETCGRSAGFHVLRIASQLVGSPRLMRVLSTALSIREPPPWLVLSLVWIVWTGWHSWWFPKRRLRYLARGGNAYRRAFVFDIFPWVSVGFSQMWRPLLNGDTFDEVLTGRFSLHPFTVAIGVLVCCGALFIIIYAIRCIGIHNAAFMREFVEVDSFEPVQRGIYRVILHPLFLSGIAYSCGLAIGVATWTAVQIAALNVAYGFVYVPLENRRLRGIFGQTYERYESRSGRISL
jgi:protein-S-isoprenylcysteine O-methyltransferase Ste14